MENNDFKANQKQNLLISVFFFSISLFMASMFYGESLPDKSIVELVGVLVIYMGLILYPISILFFSWQLKKGTNKKYKEYINKVSKFQNETIDFFGFILHILLLISILSLITHFIFTIPSTGIIWLNTMVDAFNSTNYQLIAFSIIIVLKIILSDLEVSPPECD